MKPNMILVTGADGYIGRKWIAKQLKNQNLEFHITAWVRAHDESEFENKKNIFLDQLPAASNLDHLHFAWGDLRSEAPFSMMDKENIKCIIHSAAITKFNVEEQDSIDVNWNGTKKILDFAEKCPNLEQGIFLSTIYASGLLSGVISEINLSDVNHFANFYEKSKWQSEQEILKNNLSSKWKIIRVSTIICDDESGCVTQYNVFHNTLKLLYHGLLSILPGMDETPIYLITGEEVVEGMDLIRTAKDGPQIYHLSSGNSYTLSLGELIDTVFKEFNKMDEFQKRNILRPLFSDKETFDILVDGLHTFAGGVVNQALSSISPFGHQLFITKEISIDHLSSLTNKIGRRNKEDWYELVGRVCQQLVASKWGRVNSGK